MDYETIIEKLKKLSNPKSVKHMARFGINPNKNLGISIYELRELAKQIEKNHELALKLWKSGIHDARLLACFVDRPNWVTENQMDLWAHDFDSWDVCDQVCTSLFDRSVFAWKKVFEWAESDKEFIKRGAFSLIAGLAVHDKDARNEKFDRFGPLIKSHSLDDRNYVKKAVNWALRNIGKRNLNLNKKMIQLAKEISSLDSKSARWIASDALRELKSEKIQNRIKNKKKNIKK